jgi:hypothetical protein
LTDINHFGLRAQALLHQSDGENEDPCKCNTSPDWRAFDDHADVSRRLAKVHYRHAAVLLGLRARSAVAGTIALGRRIGGSQRSARLLHFVILLARQKLVKPSNRVT